MKRWFTNLIIGTYLSALAIGIVAHTLNFGSSSHPVMYYFVWDMFCGWSSHEIRYHVIGEGESGQFYEVAPGPWMHFMPYGDLDRLHYDALGNSHRKMALNTLKRTDHEPMRRIIMIEEVWPKKYNLSDRIWAMRFDEPKDKLSYFWQVAEMTEEGRVMSAVPNYITYLHSKSIADNPRLVADTHKNRPQYVIDPKHRMNDAE